MKRLFLLAGLMLATLSSEPAMASDTGPFPLGKDLAGEDCRLDTAPSLVAPVGINCGNETGAVGTVRSLSLAKGLPADSAQRLVSVAHSALADYDSDGAPIHCEAPTWLDAEGGPVLQVCTIPSNGWPHVIVADGTDVLLTIADGPPSLLPVLAASVAMQTHRPLPNGAVDRAVARLAATIPTTILHAGSADSVAYRQLIERGRLASGLGDFAAAEDAYRQALAIETKLFGGTATPVGETLLELALEVSNQARFDEAAALFLRATPILEGAADPLARARLASYLALDAANRRHYEDALKFARNATDAYRTGLSGNDETQAAVMRAELAHSLRIEAEMMLRLNNLPGAQAAGEESLWIVSEEPGLPLWWRPDTLGLMGEINAKEGRTVAAERDFLDEVALDKQLFGDTEPAALASMRLGAFYAGQGVHKDSIAAFQYSFGILDKNPASRRLVVADQIVPYIAAAAPGATDPATAAAIFRASQYVGANVTDETVLRLAEREAAGDPALARMVADLADAERARDSARVELASENAKSDEERDSDRLEKLNTDFETTSATAQALKTKLVAAYPAYATLADPGPAELSRVMTQLRPGEALMSFVIGNSGAFGLLVTPSGLTVKPLDISADDLEDAVAGLRSAFVPSLGKMKEFDLASSSALYGKILAPFDSELASVSRLIAIPTGSLANLPLALLVTKPPAGAGDHNYAAAAWLVRRMAISTIPSASEFLSLRSAVAVAQAPASRFLAIADPIFRGTGKPGGSLNDLAGSCIADGPVPSGVLSSLPPLPETEGEVTSIGRTFGADRSTYLIGSAANEENVRAHSDGRFAVVYFATHGLLPGELRCATEPALALTPPAQLATTPASDGLLKASEIAGLHMSADLVVLSACNTAAGGGGRFGGGALEGLADAFFDAGAGAVLATHWQIPSHSTVELMTTLFSRRAADPGEGLADALRQAQLALIGNPATAHPFNWAAFTMIGEGGGSAVPAAQRSVRLEGAGGS